MTKEFKALIKPEMKDEKLDVEAFAKFALATGIKYTKENLLETLKEENYTEKEIEKFFEIYNKG